MSTRITIRISVLIVLLGLVPAALALIAWHFTLIHHQQRINCKLNA